MTDTEIISFCRNCKKDSLDCPMAAGDYDRAVELNCCGQQKDIVIIEQKLTGIERRRAQNRESERRARAANPEKFRARQKAWQDKHREEQKAKKRAYYRAHREEILARKRELKRIRDQNTDCIVDEKG
nr:MAG TPA: hypothetical protein [Ackermannviridae sp.]